MEQLADTYLRAGMSVSEILDEFQRQLLIAALKLNAGNILRTAQAQKVHRNTLTRRMQKFGVKKQAGRPWGGKKVA